MRYRRYFILLLILVAGCKKSDQVVFQPGKITGRWELRMTSGSIAGVVKYQVGNGNTREFSNDSVFVFKAPNAPNIMGTYTLQRNGDSNWLLQLHYLADEQAVTVNSYIEIDNNGLVFLPAQQCCDIPASTYTSLN